MLECKRRNEKRLAFWPAFVGFRQLTWNFLLRLSLAPEHYFFKSLTSSGKSNRLESNFGLSLSSLVFISMV